MSGVGATSHRGGIIAGAGAVGIMEQADAARGRRGLPAAIRPHARMSGDQSVLRARSPQMMPIRAFSYTVRTVR